MIAKQSVYLNTDRSKAVAEGDKDARWLLVREGHEISEGEADKYDGAASLIGKARSGPSVDEQRPTLDLNSNKPQKAAANKRSPKAAKAKK